MQRRMYSRVRNSRPPRLLDPPLLEGGSYVTSSVCPSVRHSVSDTSSHTSHHQILLIFCIKLAYYKRFKVTKPDFRKKNVLAQNWAKWAQNGPNRGFSAIFSSLNHQFSLILHIMIDSNDIQQLMLVVVLKKNVLAQNQGHLGMPGPENFSKNKNNKKKSKNIANSQKYAIK